jgi:hypothetical protein
MNFVKIAHPDVEQHATVPETALEHWARAGWTLAPEPEPKELDESDEDAPAATAPVAAKPKTPKPSNRQNTTED